MTRLVLIALAAVLLPACGAEIGDSCSTNLDCATNGSRDCDLAQPGGYCTINGCDERSCPGEAVCIRIFPYETATQSCQSDADCASDDICLPDNVCVPRISERRFCQRKCGSNGDCRGGYECREAGIQDRPPTSRTYGSIALVANADENTVVRFCAPASQQ